VRELAEDAVYHADAGGRFSAALKPIRGADRIARFFAGVRVKFPLPEGAFPRLALINGLPGVVIQTDAQVLQTFACEIDADGRVAAIYTTRNPEKLRHVSAATLSTA
jgi:RNA polymerase sigma-70 factor (ECF subfamily)